MFNGALIRGWTFSTRRKKQGKSKGTSSGRAREQRLNFDDTPFGELDQDKLTPLLTLKYNNSISDAVADLGRPEDIRQVLVGFQKYLYQEAA